MITALYPLLLNYIQTKSKYVIIGLLMIMAMEIFCGYVRTDDFIWRVQV